MVLNTGITRGNFFILKAATGMGRWGRPGRQRGPRNTLGGYIHWRGRFPDDTRSWKALDQEAGSEGGSGGKKRPRLSRASNTKNLRAIANKSTLFFSNLQLATARIRSRKSRARHLHLPLSCTRNRLENKVIFAAIFSYEEDRPPGPLNRPSCESGPTWPVAGV
jgi:hypothetical protein